MVVLLLVVLLLVVLLLVVVLVVVLLLLVLLQFSSLPKCCSPEWRVGLILWRPALLGCVSVLSSVMAFRSQNSTRNCTGAFCRLQPMGEWLFGFAPNKGIK